MRSSERVLGSGRGVPRIIQLLPLGCTDCKPVSALGVPLGLTLDREPQQCAHLAENRPDRDECRHDDDEDCKGHSEKRQRTAPERKKLVALPELERDGTARV